MNREQKRTLARWLRSERAGDDLGAERALRTLLTALPPTAVAVDFADRVLAASGVGAAAAARRGLPAWVWRAAFGAWLVSAFFALFAALGFVIDLSRSGQLVALSTRALVGLSRLGSDALAALGGLWRAAEAVSAAASGPATLLLALVCALASLMALRALSFVLASERSPHHA